MTIKRNVHSISVQGDSIKFGDYFSLNFQRTLRIPDDGKTYPLPPGLGKFPVKRVDDYRDSVPKQWVDHGGVFIPMYQREALWILFQSTAWRPHAVKVAIGKVNAVSGETWSQDLRDTDKDYMVSPPQPWLDGINAGENYIKQFVAMPLGMGYTVEGQVTGKEEHGGLQIIVYPPKPGLFENKPATRSFGVFAAEADIDLPVPTFLRKRGGKEMGLGAGGKMKQKIYPDPHGIDTWDTDDTGRVFVHIVNSLVYREITGEEAPPTPVTAKTYAKHNLPWFDLYDETKGDIAAPAKLKGVKSVKEMDEAKGFQPQQDDDSVDTPHVKKLKLDDDSSVRDGEW